LLAAALVPASACQGAAVPAAPIEQSAAGLDQIPLSVRSNGRIHRFIVEVARTTEEQNYGLMNRGSLAPDRGMIFPYDPPIAVAFWMKNTLIPLDIIFIAPGGKILNIAANTTPLSLEQVPSAGPVEAVLELAGGRAAELGIEPGDQVEWQR
jgi:hypothetical protein